MYDSLVSPLNGIGRVQMIGTCQILIQCHILKISVQNSYFIKFYSLALSDMAGTQQPVAPIYCCGPKTFSSPMRSHPLVYYNLSTFWAFFEILL